MRPTWIIAQRIHLGTVGKDDVQQVQQPRPLVGCRLRVNYGLPRPTPATSAFGGKADLLASAPERPLLAKRRHSTFTLVPKPPGLPAAQRHLNTVTIVSQV